MSFISPKLIARIYHALGQDRASDAVLLLRQHAFASRFCPNKDGELVAEVSLLADSSFAQQDVDRAEEHYELGLALYESCALGSDIDALRCVAGLMKIAELRQDWQAMLPLLDSQQRIAATMRRQLCKPKAVAIDNAA